MTGPWRIKYELIWVAGKRRAMLLEDATFYPPFKGYEGRLEGSATTCWLTKEGELHIPSGFVWDFGSGAFDTPDVVQASLAHDALCLMTDKGVLPWEVRKKADAYYRELLRQYRCPWWRRWYQWAAVRTYSKTVAYWKRKK